jgi:hypothetical protein
MFAVGRRLHRTCSAPDFCKHLNKPPNIHHIMETNLHFKLTNPTGAAAEGAAKATLETETLTLNPELNEPQLYAYTDITTISDADYQIHLQLTGDQTLTLNALGYEYDNFLTRLFRLRGEQLLKLLLMDEKQLQPGVNARYSLYSAQGQPMQRGECEARVYETALIVLPQKSDPLRQPYSYLSQVAKQDYKLTLTDDLGEKLELTQLGAKFDPFAKALSEAMNALMRRSQETVKALVPEADPAAVAKLAALLKDGRAASKRQVDAVAPAFWKRLAAQIQSAGIAQEYGYLEAASEKGDICVGVKRGLMGDLTGSYVWLLFPIHDADGGRLLNAVAMEAFTTNNNPEQKQDTTAPAAEETQTKTQANSGKATYFFRFMDRNAYAKTTNAEATTAFDLFLQNVNRCMTDINFRREPIYLTEDALDNPKYAAYRYAVAKLSSLKTLRRQFIGRVIHQSFEQWRGDVASLLNFNQQSTSDLEKWKRGTE